MYLLISHLLIFSHLLNTCYRGRRHLCHSSAQPPHPRLLNWEAAVASLRAHRHMRGPTLSLRTTAQTGSPGRENAVDAGVAPALWGSEPRKQLLLWDARPAVEERSVCIIFPQTTPWRGAEVTPPVPTRRETPANGCCGGRSQQENRAPAQAWHPRFSRSQTLPSQGQKALGVSSVAGRGLSISTQCAVPVAAPAHPEQGWRGRDRGAGILGLVPSHRLPLSPSHAGELTSWPRCLSFMPRQTSFLCF